MERLLILTFILILPCFLPQTQKPLCMEGFIQKQAKERQIPASLIKSIIKHESNFNPKATRKEPHLKAESIGLMQILDIYWVNSETCPGIKSKHDLLDAEKNITCGLNILESHLNKYPSTKDALIAYNGGHGCFKSKKCLTQASRYADKILKTELS